MNATAARFAAGRRPARRALAAALVAVTVGAVCVPVASAAASAQAPRFDVSRYGGTDRYSTSLKVAEAVARDAGGSLEWVVMVSGRSWTDAVVAAPLAGALGAPVLATPPGELRADAARFLRRTGVSKALLVGAESDTEGVGPTAARSLEELNIAVERVTRPDQYATSVAAAKRLGTPGDMGRFGRTAVVASGEVFADALVAGAFAARGQHPILLTKPHIFRRDVARYLTDKDVEHVVLMGGKAALHTAIEDAITELGIEVTRVAGTTRYDTAVKAADLVDGRYGSRCFSTRRVGLARADIPFDSFSAAPLLSRLCAPLLLADPGAVPRSTAAVLNRARGLSATGSGNDADLHIFGGNAAVSRTAIDNYHADPLGTEGGRLRPKEPCVPGLGDEPIPVLGDVFSVGASWSRDCTKIAYTGWVERYDGRFYVANVDGTARTQLFDHGIGTPDWSPDGTKMVFALSSGKWLKGEPVSHIWMANADGSGLRQITDGDFRDESPSWSPDGKRIAFAREHLLNRTINQSYADQYIAVMDPDGSNIVALTRGGLADRSPAWSPDGKWIAYDLNQDLWIMDPQGENGREIATVYSPDDHSWSPDSKHIAYVTFEYVDDDTYVGGKRHDHTVTIASIDSPQRTEAVRYVSHPVSNSFRGTFTIIRRPQWAPDGRSIMYERNTHQGDAARTYVVPVPAL